MSAIQTIRRHLRPIRRMAKVAHTRLLELPYLLRRASPGTQNWLIQKEVHYGGYVTDVARRQVSPLDGRSPAQLASGGMTGGDRMLHHGYGKTYAQYLEPFLSRGGLTLAEFGILKGTGLAVWCDLFPTARIIGFDIDLGHFEDNRAALLKRGAFQARQPEVFEYDQLLHGSEKLGLLLGGDKFDIVIDDGLHSVESIVTTWRSIRPHLSERFVFFIEDYAGLLDICGAEFDGCDTYAFGLMTVVSRGVSVNGLSV
jgi:hypothetical protein